MKLANSIFLAALSAGLALGCEGVLGSDSHSGTGTETMSDAPGKRPTTSGDEAVSGAVDGLKAGAPVTLLARLTNAEYVRGLELLLELPSNSAGLVGAKSALPPEPSVNGLQNDAATQSLTQVAIAGFERLALAASEDLLGGAKDNQALAGRLGCTYVDDAALDECLVSYGATLLERASRGVPQSGYFDVARTLLEEVVALQVAEGVDATSFASRVLQLQSLVTYVALSPDYLLLLEGANAAGEKPGEAIELTGYEIASRLSFFLSGEPPDALLLEAAKEDRLLSAEDRIHQVERLLGRPEGINTFVKSLVGWLGINEGTTDAADLEALTAYLNAWLQDQKPFDEFYNGAIEVETTAGSTATQQVGVLGMRAYLGAHTFPPTPAFITRGVFVVEQLLCSELPDDLPAEAFEGGAMTEREVFEIHATQPCATCHIAFDNFGAAFQNFEPEANTFDPGFAPLGEGFLLNPTGDIDGEISNLEQLGEKMGASDRAPACMAQLFYRHAMRRSLRGGDGEVVTRLVGDWVQSDMSLHALLIAIASAEEFALLYP